MIIVLIIVNVCGSLALEGSEVLKNLGEKQYTVLTAKSSVSKHGPCWYNALISMKNNCEHLNDHEHSLLALKFANCFLQDSGHVSYDCHLATSEDTRRECINEMSDRAFNVYNEFYTHTTHICFYLNYEAWKAETDNTINLLYKVSSQMKEQLFEASELQNEMLRSQKEGLKIQNEILDHGKELGNVLKSSSKTVNDMVIEFKESAKDQKELLYDIFSYIRTFQNWIIGEVSWFQSIMYYMISCILFALFTSSRRTAEARIALFAILSINITLERMLVQYYEKTMHHSTDNKIEIVYVTWSLRKISLTLCAVTLLYTYYCYKDRHLESFNALRRIEHRLNKLQTLTSIGDNHDYDKPIRYSERLAIKRLHAVSMKQPCSNSLPLSK
ncbi:hypothetical protein KPH14_001885 [Odynerus spinipes]|uniref:Protein GAMETE EXPRESSED 1 n=1 Tax=Odynerus spinipes TaxID=1348599 RepID=A0AAD9RZZ8_9HYME|nr:hypothetical protein KPH14_001885 [Odynerus spinipes]